MVLPWAYEDVRSFKLEGENLRTDSFDSMDTRPFDLVHVPETNLKPTSALEQLLGKAKLRRIQISGLTSSNLASRSAFLGLRLLSTPSNCRALFRNLQP